MGLTKACTVTNLVAHSRFVFKGSKATGKINSPMEKTYVIFTPRS